MAANRIVTDGDYSLEGLVGTPSVVFPFFDKNDNETFEVTSKHRVDYRSYKAAKIMQKARISPYGYAYLVDQSEATDVGNGILEFTRTYSSVPKKRAELTTTNHSRQELIGGELIETQETVPAAVIYEYSLKPLKQIDAPRCVIVDGVPLTYGNFGTFVPGRLYLAEDTEVGFYKGKIYFRKSIYIKWKALKLRN